MSATTTEQLFQEDAYLDHCTARVLRLTDRGGIVFDRSVCYASSGGQPGDSGRLETGDGQSIAIATTVFEDGKSSAIVHVPAENAAQAAQALRPGDEVTIRLDWEARHQYMRVHSCLHLLCALVKFPVTGGQIGAGTGRLDFNIEDASAIDKVDLTAKLKDLIEADHAISHHWISDEALATKPDMVRTMAVKPPMGQGRVRIIDIGEGGAVDRQPCGGTHVRSTAEIGPAEVTKIEKKGRLNRRVRISLL